ncbi:IclR family transcriptional regulator [Sporosarcina cascadiensis]|uniref:IclR family transcriptional regulator n=1 Tax=Sporosarcina cascadiensis TaxID=2660747 RepID=UPI00129A98FE|nr:IclR family transcriptional regulator [Sporosarcina cascadiensis]
MLKTVNLALVILKMFTRKKSVWGGRELAAEMGLNHTNVYRILETLERNGFISKDPITKQYKLGSAVWELGTVFYENLNVQEMINPHLQELCDQTGESVFFTVLDGDDTLMLTVIEPENKVRFPITPGSRAPLYVGASYRSILAYLSDERIEKVLSGEMVKFTDKTKTDPDELRKELQLIKKNGFAMSQSEYTPDVVATAVPLIIDGEVLGSLTVAGPSYRIDQEQQSSFIPHLRKTRDAILCNMQKYNLAL